MWKTPNTLEQRVKEEREQRMDGEPDVVSEKDDDEESDVESQVSKRQKTSKSPSNQNTKKMSPSAKAHGKQPKTKDHEASADDKDDKSLASEHKAYVKKLFEITTAR